MPTAPTTTTRPRCRTTRSAVFTGSLLFVPGSATLSAAAAPLLDKVARVVRLGEEKEACFRALVAAEGLAPLPGASEWLRRLDRAGWRQAIASSAKRSHSEIARRQSRIRCASSDP